MLKTLDNNGRWRKNTVGFRMSQEESDNLNTKVKLSGLTKQDYIINRCLDREIVVVGNPRVYKALRNQMDCILEELKRLEKLSEMSDEFFTTLNMVVEILNGMKCE